MSFLSSSFGLLLQMFCHRDVRTHATAQSDKNQKLQIGVDRERERSLDESDESLRNAIQLIDENVPMSFGH